MPREYTEAWENYVERNCFMENIYQMQDGVLRKEYRYYPWVPFLLACQSLLFYLPHLIWTQLNILTGIHCLSVVFDDWLRKRAIKGAFLRVVVHEKVISGLFGGFFFTL